MAKDNTEFVDMLIEHINKVELGPNYKKSFSGKVYDDVGNRSIGAGINFDKLSAKDKATIKNNILKGSEIGDRDITLEENNEILKQILIPNFLDFTKKQLTGGGLSDKQWDEMSKEDKLMFFDVSYNSGRFPNTAKSYVDYINNPTEETRKKFTDNMQYDNFLGTETKENLRKHKMEQGVRKRFDDRLSAWELRNTSELQIEDQSNLEEPNILTPEVEQETNEELNRNLATTIGVEEAQQEPPKTDEIKTIAAAIEPQEIPEVTPEEQPKGTPRVTRESGTIEGFGSPEKSFTNEDLGLGTAYNYNYYSVFKDDPRFTNFKQQQWERENKTDTSGLTGFGKFIKNSIVTTTSVGALLPKITNLNTNLKADPNFRPFDMPDYEEIQSSIPANKLKEIVLNSFNKEQFYSNVQQYKAYEEASKFTSEYFNDHPLTGLAGTFVSQVVDPINYMGFAGVAKLAKMSKVIKSIGDYSKVSQAILKGAAINMTQEVIQESIISQLDQSRDWEMNDYLIGASAAALMGGAIGGALHKGATLKMFRNMNRYSKEKNLEAMEGILRDTEGKIDVKDYNKLKEIRDGYIDDLSKAQDAAMAEELWTRQQKVKDILIENETAKIMSEKFDHDVEINRKIQLEKERLKQETVQPIKDIKEEIQFEHNFRIDNESRLAEINKEIKTLTRKGGKKNINRATRLQSEKVEVLKKLEKGKKDLFNLKKRLKQTKQKVGRTLKKQSKDSNDTIKKLELERKNKELELRERLNDFRRKVSDDDSILVKDELFNMGKTLREDLGFDHVKLDTMDDLDRILGVSFDGPARSAGAAATRMDTGASIIDREFKLTYLNKLSHGITRLISDGIQQEKLNPASGITSYNSKPDSLYAKTIRMTRLKGLMDNTGLIGRYLNNKAAVRAGDNEILAGFMSMVASDGAGRKVGTLGLLEHIQRYSNRYGGAIAHDFINVRVNNLHKLTENNQALRQALNLSDNKFSRYLQIIDPKFQDKASRLLLDELVENGSSRIKFGDEVGQFMEDWVAKWNKQSEDVLAHARRAGVSGVEEFADRAEKNYFHREWDTKKFQNASRIYKDAFIAKLVKESMIKGMEKKGYSIDAKMLEDITKISDDFANGLINKDLATFSASIRDVEGVIKDFERKGLLNENREAIHDEVNRLLDIRAKKSTRELSAKTTLDLSVELEAPNGDMVSLKDFLHSNIIQSQMDYMGKMSSRITMAEKGIKDIDELDRITDAVHEWDVRHGKSKEAIEYNKQVAEETISALKNGGIVHTRTQDSTLKKAVQLAKRMAFAGRMMYMGISAIPDLGNAQAELGSKYIHQAINGSYGKYFKTLLTGGFTHQEIANDLTRQLSALTGVGLEAFGTDSIISSSRMITSSKVGNFFEDQINRLSKATRNSTAHIEETNRKVILNAVGIELADIFNGVKGIGGHTMSGLSKRNAVELGLAEVVGKGTIKESSKFKAIQEELLKFAKDMDGKLIKDSKKPLADLDMSKWNPEILKDFTDVVQQRMSHIVVSPDDAANRLWHSSLLGQLINQFRSFANNAQSKIAGHSLNQVFMGMEMGDKQELFKYMNKLFWNATYGKLALMTYTAINFAGRDDFEERMAEAMSIDSLRDWTSALGRGSIVIGVDTLVDTAVAPFGVEPLFNSSFTGVSRNRLNLGSTPVGQIIGAGFDTGSYALEGETEKAMNSLLKMTPIRRQLGINQLLNVMGAD